MRTKTSLLLLVVVVSAVALASGCATGVQVPEQVKVPVPVACLKAQDVPAKPGVRSEADLLNMPRGLRTLAAWADLWKMHVYATRLAALVEGCSRLPAAAPASTPQ